MFLQKNSIIIFIYLCSSRESIIESKYTQQLRISISKQSFYDGNDNDSEHRDSLLEENRNDYYDSNNYSYNELHTYKDDFHENDNEPSDSNHKHSFDNDYSYANEVSIDEALQWNMRRQPNIQKAYFITVYFIIQPSYCGCQ